MKPSMTFGRKRWFIVKGLALPKMKILSSVNHSCHSKPIRLQNTNEDINESYVPPLKVYSLKTLMVKNIRKKIVK